MNMLELLLSQLQAGTPPSDLDYDTIQVLLAPDGVSGIKLGYSCAISGDGTTIAIGAYSGRSIDVPTGAVYVYEKIGGSYTWIQKLTASDGAINDYFGFSVAISGDGTTISIGAYADGDKGTYSGSVYVFKYNDSSYAQVQKLTASDGAANDYFGYSVSISGDGSTISIGAYGVDDKGANSGSVYVFKYNGSSYAQVQKLTASDGAINDYFGFSVAISSDGSTISIGAYGVDDKGSNSGSAYVFKYNGSNYTQVQKLTASDGAMGDFFGYSVSISGDGSTISIGAYSDDDKGSNSGSVYVFKYTGSSYAQVQKLTASDGATGDFFGFSVAISSDGSTISIGAYSDDDKGNNSGSVYVFKHEETQYREVKKLTGNKNVANGNFGRSVAIAEDAQQIVVGGENWTDDAGVATGAGFVFS